MSKAIPCEVIIHGRRREYSGGKFSSISEAKRETRYITQPKTFKKLTNI